MNFFLFIILILSHVCSKDGCTLQPNNIRIYVGSSQTINYTFTRDEILANSSTKMNILVGNDNIAQIIPAKDNVSLVVKGLFLGRTTIFIELYDNKSVVKCEPLHVVVVRKMKIVSKIFRGLIVGFVILNTFLYGCKLDAAALRQIGRKPVSIFISVICQLIGMPLLAYTIILIYKLNMADTMGLFLVGCSPGGGSSNMWTFLLGGDLLLSICLTFINTLGTFASMPLWFAVFGRRVFPNFETDDHFTPFFNIYNKGGLIQHGNHTWSHTTSPPYLQSIALNNVSLTTTASLLTPKNLTGFDRHPSVESPLAVTSGGSTRSLGIPYARICTSLFSVSIPPLIGMAFRWFRPVEAHKAGKGAKPLTVTMLILIIVVGIWDNLYIFRVMGNSYLGGGARLLFASMSLPWAGFLLGYGACQIANFIGLYFFPTATQHYRQRCSRCPPAVATRLKKISDEQRDREMELVRPDGDETCDAIPNTVKRTSNQDSTGINENPETEPALDPGEKSSHSSSHYSSSTHSSSSTPSTPTLVNARNSSQADPEVITIDQNNVSTKKLSDTSTLADKKQLTLLDIEGDNPKEHKVTLNELNPTIPAYQTMLTQQDTSTDPILFDTSLDLSLKHAEKNSSINPTSPINHRVKQSQNVKVIAKKHHRHRNLIPLRQQIAIFIETGLQNAGLAVLLLWGIYPQPEADLAITVPVACTIFTPIPLLIIYCVKVGLNYYWKRSAKLVVADPLS